MRTLDEVIKAVEEDLECAEVSYPESFYDYDNHKDALYYLREYKNTDENYKKAIAHVTEVIDHYEKMVADYLSVNNPPLTWDELRQMEGKPVWIWLSPRIKNTPGSGRWEIIYKFNPIGGNKNLFEMEMESRSRFKRKYQGDLWQAYRKEK